MNFWHWCYAHVIAAAALFCAACLSVHAALPVGLCVVAWVIAGVSVASAFFIERVLRFHVVILGLALAAFALLASFGPVDTWLVWGNACVALASVALWYFHYVYPYRER